MSSAVYFKFKASLKQYTIPFEGSAISVKDLRNAIRLQCGLKSNDFELQIIDKQGKEFAKEDDLIPKFSDLVVRRLPKPSDPPKKKIANPEDMTRRDPYGLINSLPKINPYSSSINLAKSNISDDEKIDIITKRCSEEYSEKNYQVKSKPYGIPPPSYVCNKCHQGGHWIHECPGLRDKDGRLLDFKIVKRPTGIPQDFLLEVAPGTPGAYLTKEGKYMVPIKDAEAYAMGKKEKRPFSIEENPPYIEKEQELPSNFKCPLCSKLIENPTITPCCTNIYCEKCITDYLYDPEVNGSRKCPNCQFLIEHHTSLLENELLRQLIQCWKANMLTKEIVDSCITSLNPISIKKTELNEDSSKSPELKYDSVNSDSNIANSNAELKTNIKPSSIESEEKKVFVNNRRVLKPKVTATNQQQLHQSTITAESVIGSLKKEMVINETPLSIKQEKDEQIQQYNDKDIDVNDFIFGKVEDFDDTGGKSSNVILKSDFSSTVPPSEKAKPQNTNSTFENSSLKIETIGKRSDLPNAKLPTIIDRKFDCKSSSQNKNNHNGCSIVTNNDLLSSTSSSLQQVFPNIIPNAGIDATTTHLLSQFPSSTPLVTSVQHHHHQLINNQGGSTAPLALNPMDSLQWPIINPMYNNMQLHSIFGGSMNQNAVSTGWFNNGGGGAGGGGGLAIPSNHSMNSGNRILTKEEFYEKQRQLRAKKMRTIRHHRHHSSSNSRHSRSPVDESSRAHKSSASSKYRQHEYNKFSVSNSSSNRDRDMKKHRGDHSSPRLQDGDGDGHYYHSDGINALNNKEMNGDLMVSSRMRPEATAESSRDDQNDLNSSSYKVNYSKSDIGTIDPKFMQDSITTFLRFLTNNDDKDRKDNNNDKEFSKTITTATESSIVQQRRAGGESKSSYQPETKYLSDTAVVEPLPPINKRSRTELSDQSPSAVSSDLSMERHQFDIGKCRKRSSGSDKCKSEKSLVGHQHSSYTIDEQVDVSGVTVATAISDSFVSDDFREVIKKRKKNKSKTINNEDNIEECKGSKKKHKKHHHHHHKHKKSKKLKKTKKDR